MYELLYNLKWKTREHNPSDYYFIQDSRFLFVTYTII